MIEHTRTCNMVILEEVSVKRAILVGYIPQAVWLYPPNL